MGPSSKTNSPVLFGGDVYNIPSGDFDEYSELTSDGLSPESRIHLRGRPVTRIHSIRNRQGAFIDPSKYYLVDHSTIHIVAGTPWTPCNTEITYSYGAVPPVAGRMAARLLALEFAKLWAGDDDCQLPQRITSVSRQGVSYTILDQQDFIDELKTGMYVVDLFLKSVNPDKARAKAKVFSVDQPRGRRYTPKALVYTADVLKDIEISRGTVGATVLDADAVNGDFLIDEAGWTPVLNALNWSGTKTKELPASSIVIDEENRQIILTVSYSDVVATLGMTDPGSYSLYGTRPNQTNPSINDVVLITTGNLRVNLTA
jgi:hypothetical protein